MKTILTQELTTINRYFERDFGSTVPLGAAVISLKQAVEVVQIKPGEIYHGT
jgi:hypothetical protein